MGRPSTPANINPMVKNNGGGDKVTVDLQCNSYTRDEKVGRCVFKVD
jgi:hypothetical protein